MVENVIVSGVIMTRVPVDGAPYYTINYDDESGKTDSVTGGTGVNKTVYVYKEANSLDFDSLRLQSFVVFARKIEELCLKDALDIEFCQDSNGVLHLLQVRPICTQAHWIPDIDNHITGNIKFIKGFISQKMLPYAALHGSRTILGVMPDWNPAEMIGVTPRPLGASLYRSLITKEVWHEARGRMGYRNLPSVELMVLIGGRPFIDVRASFNSFLPRELPHDIGKVLIDAWLNRLDRNPQFHDKIEFEVAQTALDFCFAQHLDERYPGILSFEKRKIFESALRNLTLNCLDIGSSGTLSLALNTIRDLELRQKVSPLPSAEVSFAKDSNILGFIGMLLDECRMYGTLPFSILARHAFIAESLLKTAVIRCGLKIERLSAFKQSIQTVSGELSLAAKSVCSGEMSPKDFMASYGHLRPGSYDILSPRYADREGIWSNALNSPVPESHDFAFDSKERNAIDKLLIEVGLGSVNTENFEYYARQAIAGRERAKFVFSRHLSDILEYITIWGNEIGLSRDDLSFLDVQDVLKENVQTILCDKKIYYSDMSLKGRKLFELSRGLKLGYIIRSEGDISVIPQHRSAPNFVGDTEIERNIIILNSNSDSNIKLKDLIVCIENADP
jgi:hypothetical protein